MNVARWLDDHEQRTWRALLHTAQGIEAALDRQLQRDVGISHSQYAVLAKLSESADRRLRMSELADRVSFSPSRLSHAVARMERAGWVRREPCADDRRGSWAVLTPEGFGVVRSAAPGHVEEVRARVFDRLTEAQQQHLRELCELLLEGLASARPVV